MLFVIFNINSPVYLTDQLNFISTILVPVAHLYFLIIVAVAIVSIKIVIYFAG